MGFPASRGLSSTDRSVELSGGEESEAGAHRATRSSCGELVAAVGSTASRARAAVNDAIFSVVARAKKSWGPGVLEQMQKQNTRRACPSAVKSLSRAPVHFL